MNIEINEYVVIAVTAAVALCVITRLIIGLMRMKKYANN